MLLVDTHCHIDLYPSPQLVAADADATGVRTIAVTNAPSVFFFTAGLAQKTRHLRAALGLHPELVATHGKEIDSFLSMLDQTRYIGEIGLDYTTRDENNRVRQREILQTIVTACRGAGNKVLTVHSRRAASDVNTIIGADFPGTVILHWFSGSKKELLQGLDHGYYFSVNPAMTTSDSGRKLIALIPLDRLLTETDGPFVTCGRTPASPSDVMRVITFLAEQWHRTEHEVAAQVLNNLTKATGEF